MIGGGGDTYLQDARAAVEALGGIVPAMRVALDTYVADRDSAAPDGIGDQEAPFKFFNGLALYGGYAGSGAPDPDN